MIKIEDILEEVNNGIKTHYFKGITTYCVAELITMGGDGTEERITPAVYEGSGNYDYIINDNEGLIVYHRILEFDNEEDLGGGFGRGSLTTETYSVKSVFYGQQIAIDQSCKDINYNLAKEFKKLIPRRVDLEDTNRIVVTSINYNREEISKEENIKHSPESVLFSMDMEIAIKGIEVCNELKCN